MVLLEAAPLETLGVVLPAGADGASAVARGVTDALTGVVLPSVEGRGVILLGVWGGSGACWGAKGCHALDPAPSRVNVEQPFVYLIQSVSPLLAPRTIHVIDLLI